MIVLTNIYSLKHAIFGMMLYVTDQKSDFILYLNLSTCLYLYLKMRMGAAFTSLNFQLFEGRLMGNNQHRYCSVVSDM